ncbi:MAG: formylglycine-generating enzyme family protein [Planctomycetes bacterium]|nr:formylglycine-generating enzyme family protein [Planctomycetota bacterium]
MTTCSNLRAAAIAGGAVALLACSGTAQASYSTYRQSCSSSLGMPRLSNLNEPEPGRRFELQVTGLGAYKVGYLLFGFQDAYWGVNRLPLELAAFGAPGCFINIDPAVAFVVPSDGAGTARASWLVPALAAYLGGEFYNQFVTLDDAPAGRALRVTTTNAGHGMISMGGVPNMVGIVPGSFAMGSTQAPEEQPVHTVYITRPFWIGRYEVTQAEWTAMMGSNPSGFPGSVRPVETVSWDDALAYCARLTARERAAGRLPQGYQYRLPTEAEWEYCCRAGTTTPFNVGSSLTTAQANFGSVVGQTTDVGSYAPNTWGLYDMHGNVWEWPLDLWDGSANYPVGPVSDPYVPSGPYQVMRGGCWIHGDWHCRSSNRYWVGRGYLAHDIGFRVVLAPALVDYP